MLVRRLVAAAAIAAGAFAAHFALVPSQAQACGCFTPPDPSVPVVQAGENIVFHQKDGKVTAHIQIQYSGPAEEFGWLLPMPSIPDMTLGTDELFAQVLQSTQPRYRLDAEYNGNCWFDPGRNGGGFPGAPAGDSSNEDAGGGGGDPDSPLVLRDSVGPFDFAVLRADSKQPMFDWLAENNFFVPAGTDEVSDPYIREGAYFLALKLRKGNDVGDIQPVVVTYESDLPMIPIILTSVAADPDMGVQVWVLGEDRAIPRNYFHTSINDVKLDWLNAAQNYVDVVTEAVDEADGHNSFVTEYAGTTAPMIDRLDPEWRFGELQVLRSITDAVSYVDFLNQNNYPVFVTDNQGFGSFQYNSIMLQILRRHLPMPEAVAEFGIEENDYYINFNYYLTDFRFQFPELFVDVDLEFDPDEMTNEIDERFVTPTKEAGQMFRDYPMMTRLFTTMSPEEMVKDPVFSFNPDLPEVRNEHVGTLTYFCDGSDTPQGETQARITTEAGFELWLDDGTDNNPWSSVEMPWSLYTDILPEEGSPDRVKNHQALIQAAVDEQNGRGGCSVAGSRAGAGWLLLVGLGLAVSRRRRRRRV